MYTVACAALMRKSFCSEVSSGGSSNRFESSPRVQGVSFVGNNVGNQRPCFDNVARALIRDKTLSCLFALLACAATAFLEENRVWNQRAGENSFYCFFISSNGWRKQQDARSRRGRPAAGRCGGRREGRTSIGSKQEYKIKASSKKVRFNLA